MREATSCSASPYRSVRAVTGWTIFLMVALRLVIGWHFFYEGYYKVKAGGFSATPYLLASSGPLRDVFRKMVFDADGFERIQKDYQLQQLDKRYDLIVSHYKLTPDQQKLLADYRDLQKKELDKIVSDRDFGIQVEGYKDLLAQVKGQRARHDPAYLAERFVFDDKKVDKARGALLARMEKPVAEMDPVQICSDDPKLGLGLTPAQLAVSPFLEFKNRAIAARLTVEQLAAGPLPNVRGTSFPGKQLAALGLKLPPKTLTFWIDLFMMFGLLVIGACLLLGLFTRLAAFGAACFLTMFYLSMPPWLGVPDPAMIEGHYLFVNKNLIELIAALMLASSNVGRWFGLDAFLRACSDRRRRKKQSAVVLQTQSAPQNRLFVPEARTVRDPQNV